jgi:O-antigen/teichoic acid export membrane protein
MFASGILVARKLGPNPYGLYAAAFALGSLTVGGATAGVPILILRRTSEGDIDRGVIKRAALLLLALLGISVVVTAAIGAALLGGTRGATASFAAGLFFATNNLATLGQYVQMGRRRYRRSAATDIFAGTLSPFLTYGALELHAGVDGCLVAIAIACALSWSIAWTRFPDLEPDKNSTRFRLRDSLSLSAFGLMNGSYGRIDTPTLLAVAGTGAAGFYSAAYRLLGPFTLIGAAVGTFYFSRISAHSGDHVSWSRVRKRGALLLAGTGIVGAFIMIAFTPLIMHFVYGSRYDSAIAPARILLLSVIPWSLYRFKPADLASVHLEMRATIALAFGLFLDVVLVIVLGKRFGPSGAAWAWVVSESAILLALSVASRRIGEHINLGPDQGPSAGRTARQ